MKEKKVVMVKLGGSLITNKSKPYSLKRKVLEDVVGQVVRAVRDYEGKIVLGHGSGSFAHVPARKYKTMKGLVGDQSVYGYAVVEDAASKLNRIVVDELLKQEVPAVSMRMANMVSVEGEFFKKGLEKALKLGLVPVFFGDPVLGGGEGFTIWSTEKILNFLVYSLSEDNWKVEKVIHCGEVDGFLYEGEVVEEINPDNFEHMKKSVGETRGFDVTGGMLHKIESALETAKLGVESYIVGGNRGGNLYKAIIGDEFIGTKITA